VADELIQTGTIPRDDVCAERIADQITGALASIELGLERRNLAGDWNRIKIEATPVDGEDLRIRVTVPVL
jgi:hypothetical protein